MRRGRVTRNGAPLAPRDKVWNGDRLRVDGELDAEVLATLPEDIPIEIVFEDTALLVVNKPAGLVVHPGSGNPRGTLQNALLRHAPGTAGVPRSGIVHRLDKDTSGLLVVAKTLPAQVALVRQLQARTVRREYLALVHGEVAHDGDVKAPIGRHPVSRTRMAVVAAGKAARTHYRVVERFAGVTLLTPPAYCPAAATAFSRQALHAETLGLVHPVGGATLRWTVPPPADMATLIAALRALGNPGVDPELRRDR